MTVTITISKENVPAFREALRALVLTAEEYEDSNSVKFDVKISEPSDLFYLGRLYEIQLVSTI